MIDKFPLELPAMSGTQQKLINYSRRTGCITAVALTACLIIWVCAGLGIPVATFIALERLEPREDSTWILVLLIPALDMGVFLATVIWMRWLFGRQTRTYHRLLDELFEQMEMVGEPTDCGGRLWRGDGVWVSLTYPRVLLGGAPRRLVRRRRQLEVGVTAPLAIEAEFWPQQQVLFPSTCAQPARPSFSGDALAERWLDDERLQRTLYALPYGRSRLHVGATGVVWRFQAARAGLQTGDLNETNLQRWLSDLTGLSADWRAEGS